MILSSKNTRRIGIATFLVLNLGLCVFLAYLYNLQISKSTCHPVRGPITEVVKATQVIPVGTVLTNKAFMFEKVPERFLPPNPLLREDVDEFLNHPTNKTIEAGAMLRKTDFD